MGISKEQAFDCLRSADLIGIGMEADAVRRRLHPENVVSYAVDCVVHAGAGLMEEIEASGASSVRLAETAGMTFASFEETLAAIGKRFPALSVQGPSGSFVLRLADTAKLRASEAITRLKDAGLRSFTGSELSAHGDSDRVLEVHRHAHMAGICTTSGMIFGAGESLEERVEHLFALRAIQEQTGGFKAFKLTCYVPAAGSAIEAPTAVEYMRTLAVSRMVLDNIENFEVSCMAQGLKVTQMALRFGANDAGAIWAEGMASFTEEDLRRVIRDAGFIPVERDALYRSMFLNN